MLLFLVAACTPARPAASPAPPAPSLGPALVPSSPPLCAWEAGPADAPAGNDHRFRVAASPGATELCVEVDLPRGAAAPHTWAIEDVMQPYLRDLAFAGDGVFRAVPAVAGGWLVPACAGSAPCRLRYRFMLAEAGKALGDHDRAALQDGAVLAPPSTWLIRPQQVHAPFQLAVTTAPGDRFVTGLALATPGGATFHGDIGALEDTPYAAFGRLEVVRKTVPGGLVDIAFIGGRPTPAIDAWIDHGLGALTRYYGTYPIAHSALVVRLHPGSGVGGGHTMGNGGGAVLISVGLSSDPATLRDDWILVHELVHLSFPDVFRPWAEEGLATYLEPFIRARAGRFPVDEVWRSLVEGLPQGQPEAGDGGLDVTDTWGRRYWGGALFWFVADLEIRKRTGNTRSLDDALLAINRAGGNAAMRWDLDRVLGMGDGGTGVDVLLPLHRQMGRSPVHVDLDATWKSLGVALVGGKLVYDDAAPLAAVRRSMTTAAAKP